MDAKDLRTQSALSERSNDVSKYSQSGTIQCNRNKSYQDIRSNSSIKLDPSLARPCAVIGPDRVVPPTVSTDAYVRKTSLEPWLCPDATYHHLPEYPNKTINYQNLTRNISPRQTFQEDMQRIMVPAAYNSVKINSDNNFPQLADRSVSLPKNVKSNNAADVKYCDVPYAVNQTNNIPKSQAEMGMSNVNPVLVRPVSHGWPSGSVRSQRAYGAPEMYQFPEYANCAGPRPVPISHQHRTVQEEPGHMYSDSYYQESNIRYKPYPNIKERYPHTRYDYSSHYSNPFHPPPPFPPVKYDLSKPMPHHTYPGHSHFKYVSSRMPEPVMDGYHRPINQQVNYNAPFRNQIQPTYGPVRSSFSQSKISPYTSDSSMKPITSNKLLYDSNSKMYVDYENSHNKTFHPHENIYGHEASRVHAVKNQVIPNYPPVNMQTVSAQVLYKKDQIKHYDYMNHYKNFDPLTNINCPVSRHLPQFSPSAIAISPTDSSTSNDTAHTQGTTLEDYGYISQSSTASIRSIDSGVNRVSNDQLGRYYDYRYGPVIRTPFFPKSGGNLNSSIDSKDKKGINVRQFLQMWNEGDDENGENSSIKEIVVQTKTDDGTKTSKQTEVLNNQEQLYVLGLVNVPSEELSKYEHIQKISKLPENIKGYNSIELLNQFEEVIESSNMNCFKPAVNKEHQIQFRGSLPKQATGLSPRPVSPLDVESKISQSVIHKEVGCNFEIKPCSPKMSNVELAAPIRNLRGERIIEKVTNPQSNMIQSPISNRIDEVLESCKALKRQDLRTINENDKISSCKMINTQYSNNTSIKTNYSLQDLESNSGVGLASLPRLDNDIELNFPEVNQQFINANKGDSIVATIEDLPTMEMTDQTSFKTPKEALKLEIEINNRMSPLVATEKECTKLSKYRKIKNNEGENKEDNKDQKTLRTDSVIIKNPENTKRLDDLKAYSPISQFLDESQQAPINLTSQSDMNTASITDLKLTNKSQAEGVITNDTAIDFSLNKCDGISIMSTNQSFQKNCAQVFVDNVVKGDNNNKGYSYVKYNDMAGSKTNLQHNDMNYVADTDFVEGKSKNNNIVSHFNERKDMSPINNKTTSEVVDIDIINFKNVSTENLSRNTDVSKDSLHRESVTDIDGKTKIDNYTNSNQDTNCINIHTQSRCPMDIEEGDKIISSGVLSSFDTNISGKIESYSREKDDVKKMIQLNKSKVNNEVSDIYNIEKQTTIMHDNDLEIIEDKEKRFSVSKEVLNGEEVYNRNSNEKCLQSDADNKLKIDHSEKNIECTSILQDTKNIVNEQVPSKNEISDDASCNALVVNHLVSPGETQTDCDVSISENFSDEKIETLKKFPRCVGKTDSNKSEEDSEKEQSEFLNYYAINTGVNVNNNLIKSSEIRLSNFSKKLHSPQIQNLIMFNEGLCEPSLPNMKTKTDILEKAVLKNNFDAVLSVNDNRNVYKCNEIEASTEDVPSTAFGEDLCFSKNTFRFKEVVHNPLPKEKTESSTIKEKGSLKLTDPINTDFLNYNRNLNECYETETIIETLRPPLPEDECSFSKEAVIYDELLSENIVSCMIMDSSVEHDTDVNTNGDLVTNVDSLPPTPPSGDHSLSNETVLFNEDMCSPILFNEKNDQEICQESVSSNSTNQTDTEPALDSDKNIKECNETKQTVKALRLPIADDDRDYFRSSNMSNEGICESLILNDKYESDVTENKASIKLTDKFNRDSSVDNDKNVKESSDTKAIMLQLDDNRKIFGNAIMCNDEVCGSLLVNKNIESGKPTEKMSASFVIDPYINNDKNKKEFREFKTGVKELKSTVLDGDRRLSGEAVVNIPNGYYKEKETLNSSAENKLTSHENNSLEYDKDTKGAVKIQQKIPYINEFYDEIEDSDESTSINYEFASKTGFKNISSNPHNYLEGLEQDIEPVIRNITNDSTAETNNTNAVTETHTDIYRNHDEYTSQCDSKLIKHINPKNNEDLLTHRFSLKRSLSDSALNSIHENAQEGIDKYTLGWPFKRKKTNNIANNVKSNLIAQNLCNILQGNRRNSISSIYNEENVSFCILIDNNCIITESNEEEKICYTALPEDFLNDIQTNRTDEQNSDDMEEEQVCSEAENFEYSDSLIMECDQEKSIEDSWVEDVACVETVVSEDIAEDVMISTSTSPKDINLSSNEESDIFSCNISEHTDKVKYIYGEKMCNDDAQFVETLYNTPQMDVNKTLSTRESQVFDDCNRIYDTESLEKILSESNSRGASPRRSADYIEPIYSAVAYVCDKTPDNKENMNIGNMSPLQSKEHCVNSEMGSIKVHPENNNLKINEKTQDDTVHSCESSIDNVFSYKQIDDSIDCNPSCSPEVSSTTSEEKNTSILLKITNYKGSIVSQINGITSDNNRPRCKFTENKDYRHSNSKSSLNRPLITKAAQKYIPPLKESIRDLKVKLSLPQHSLLKLKQLKVSKDEPKPHKNYATSPRTPKKIKPKFEDVLMNIDKIQFKKHKEKNKKSKTAIPKVVIKKTENGSHYASTSNKDTFNPDLTGRKWQPWVFIEKNNFIDKMAIKGKTKAMYSHRKNTYVLAEKFYKYKSVSSTKFVISQPSCNDSSTGQLKYTIRLKHNY